MKLTRDQWFKTAILVLKTVVCPSFAYSTLSVIGNNDTILIYMSADDKLNWPDMMYENSRYATFQSNAHQLSLLEKADNSPEFEPIEIKNLTDYAQPLFDYYKNLSQ